MKKKLIDIKKDTFHHEAKSCSMVRTSFLDKIKLKCNKSYSTETSSPYSISVFLPVLAALPLASGRPINWLMLVGCFMMRKFRIEGSAP